MWGGTRIWAVTSNGRSGPVNRNASNFALFLNVVIVVCVMADVTRRCRALLHNTATAPQQRRHAISQRHNNLA
jgi:hypothetical protein